MKFYLFFVLVFNFQLLISQNELSAFHNFYKSGKYLEAKQEIENIIITNPKFENAQNFYYFSDVNLLLYLNSSSKDESFLEASYRAIMASLEKPDYVSLKNQINNQALIIGRQYFKLGAGEYNYQKWASAQNYLQNTANVYDFSAGESEKNQVYLYLAIASKYNNDDNNAIKYFKNLVAGKSSEVSVYIMLSEVYLKLNQTDNAVKTLESAVTYCTKDVSKVYFEIINISKESNQYDKAKYWIGQYRLKFPPNIEIDFTEGVILYEQNMTDKAIVAFNNVLKVDPGHFQANYNLGVLYYNLAMTHMQTAESFYYSDENKYRKEKDIYLEKIKVSMTYLEAAHNSDKKDKNTVSCLADIYKRLQRMEQYQSMMNLLGN